MVKGLVITNIVHPIHYANVFLSTVWWRLASRFSKTCEPSATERRSLE